MAFSTPKTNWAVQPYVNGMYAGDWFETEDYERIRQNILFLQILGQNVYDVVLTLTPMRIVSKSDLVKPDDINNLETNIVALMVGTYSVPDYPGASTWSENGSTPTFDDLNRMEDAINQMYNEFSVGSDPQLYVPTDYDAYVSSDGYTIYGR